MLKQNGKHDEYHHPVGILALILRISQVRKCSHCQEPHQSIEAIRHVQQTEQQQSRRAKGNADQSDSYCEDKAWWL